MSRLAGNRVLPLALLFALVIANAITCPAALRASGGLARDYRVTRWTSENGLPQNTARRLYRTSDGYLWIGTLYGLARFDGLRFKVFGQMNTPAMTSDAINIMVEDKKDGSLWIGTGEGLLRYSAQRQFARFLPDKDAAIGRMWASTQSGVWLQQRDNELTLWRPSGAVSWRFPNDNQLNHATHVEEEPDGSLLVASGSGLYRVTPNPTKLERLGPPNQQLDSHFSSVRDSSGNLWICSRDGVWVWNRRQWTRVYQTAPDGPRPIQVLPTRAGPVWLVLDKLGLHLLEHGVTIPFPELATPGGQIPLDLLDDPEGNLWVGTAAGLFRLQPHRIRAYTSEDGLPGDNILTTTASPDGTVWLAGGRWIMGVRAGACAPVPALHPDSGSLGPGMLVTGEGLLLTSVTNDTMAALRDGAWSVGPQLPKGVVVGRPQAFLQDRHKRLWLAGRNGAAMLDGQTTTSFTVREGLSDEDVRVLHEDRRGDIWFGTYGGGLNRLHNGRIDSFITGNGPYNNRAWWIHEDPDGIFWVATQNGLNRFVPPGVRDPANARTNTTSAAGPTEARTFTFLTTDGLMENVVNSVQEDAFGQLWLSGLRGIYRIPRKQLNEVASGARSEVQCVAFGEADGMPTSECNGGEDQPAGCRDTLGRIWFPTGKGAIVVDPASIELNERPPSVVIEQVLADDRVIHGDDIPPQAPTATTLAADKAGAPRVALPAGRGKVIEIHYTANSFVDPARVRFRFRLDGYEDAWRLDSQNRRTAFYTNLRPGEYRFIVRACNNHGVWNETGASFAFSVAPRFHQTWYFYLVCGLAAIGLAAAVQATRLRWQRRLLELDAQRALANERTRIARDLHDDLGTALTGLALELDVIRGEEPQTKPSERLAASSRRTRDLAERMREVVWAINPRCDTVPSFAGFIEQHACQLLRLAGIETKLDFPEEIPPLPMDAEARHQLSLGVREAINNVVRHANATEVRLSLKVETREGIVAVEVRDNGRGFDPERPAKTGHGLDSLRHRLARIGGTIDIVSRPGQGTTVAFRLPTDGGAMIRESRARAHAHTRTRK